MCGIAGKIDFSGPVDAELLHRMCAAMTHRGPDARGVWVDRGVGLGMQRLAIIDVAGGEQPIFNEDETIALVMNGEIYNFPDLRERLVRRGHRFSSHVDTEVLVHLYEDHGEDLVHHLRGMFAFALWDSRRRKLFCARDRVGKKPLFWARKGSRVWFASEIGALLQDSEIDRAIDPAAIDAYLAYQYVPHPMSAFREIRKLPPACTLSVTEQGETINRYWSLDFSRKLDAMPQPELEQQLRAHLRVATRIRLMSEVPLGAFLSGGIDSSAVVAAMAEQLSEPVKTFSISFSDQDFDEIRYARMVAEQFGTDHHEFRVEPEALAIMPKMARHYGEPFADPAAIPSFYLAELTRRHVTVALNGDGGDECFAGYARYFATDRASRLDWLPGTLKWAAPRLAALLPRGAAMYSTPARIRRLSARLAETPDTRWISYMSVFDSDARSRILSRGFRSQLEDSTTDDVILTPWHQSTAAERIDRLLDVDSNTYLPGALLVKIDIATMAHSVEARSPFLDQELMQFAASLPAELKLRGRDGKHILKSAMRGILPDEILDRKKMGFGVPLVSWFRNELRDLPQEILLDPGAVERGYFNRREIERVIHEHQHSQADHSYRLWALLQLEMWHRTVVEAPPIREQALA
ncbi:MAG: asparagine synthase (glutamine-hydrolyzing) [Solirubrobacterales bacterium]|nr:asparagine synthase (glutamine-hydrolyzing) [Solirubrobacterales bacterium]